MEPEHLGLYLPHNIEFLENGKPETIIGFKSDRVYIDNCHKSGYCDISEIKTLLLRPLSDIGELEAKEFCRILEPTAQVTSLDKDEVCFWYMHGDEQREAAMHFNQCHPKQFIYLLSKHFDLFGLIEAGEAINKPTNV